MQPQRYILIRFRWRRSLRISMPAFFTYTSPTMTVVSLASLSRVRLGYLRQRQRHYADIPRYWVIRVVHSGLHSAYPRVRFQAANLMFFLIYGRPEFAIAMLRTPTFITALLTLEAVLPMQCPRGNHMVLHVAACLHFLEVQSPVESPSRLTDLLAALLDHDDFFVRQAAAKLFACLTPTHFLAELLNHLTHESTCLHSTPSTPQPPDPAYAPGIQFAITCLEADLYGSSNATYGDEAGKFTELMTNQRGRATGYILAELEHTYTSLYHVCVPLVTAYADTPCGQALDGFLKQLRTTVRLYQYRLLPSQSSTARRLPHRSASRKQWHQLSLPGLESFLQA